MNHDYPNNEHVPLRQRAEAALAAGEGSNFAAAATPVQQELNVHRIELELQNEELRRTQEQLEATTQRYRELYKRAPMPYVMVRADGRIVEVNEAATTLFGLAADALVGRALSGFMEREQADRLYLHLRQASDSCAGAECALDLQTPAGVRHVRVDTLQGLGVPDLLLCAITDQTELVDARERLEQSNKTLERRVAERTRQLQESLEALAVAQKMEAIGRLAGGITHDFNNVLTVINLLAREIERDMPASSRHNQTIRDLIDATRRATGMVAKLREFTAQHGAEPPAAAVAVDGAIECVLPLLERLVGDRIELTFEAGATDAFALLDDSSFERVLMNLVTNARDAMPRNGTIRIRTSVGRLSEDRARLRPTKSRRPYLTIEVKDTGEGMNEDTKRHLFEPFFTTRPSGTGMGLATVYAIVNRVGGFIDVESSEGQGTAFRVFLPTTDEDPHPETNGPRPWVKPRAFASVLLVDDEPIIRRMAARIIRAHGFEVIVARDGAEALELCAERTEPFDALVTDVVMPHISGVELAARVTAQNPDTAVLFISGDTRGMQIDAGSNFLAKPFEPAALVEMLEKALRQVTRSEAGAPGLRSPHGSGINHCGIEPGGE